MAVIRPITRRIGEDRDQIQQAEDEFPGPVSLIEITDPNNSTYSDLDHPADSGFSVYQAILDQYHIVVRGHDPANVGLGPWSPVACFGGGGRLF